MLTVHTLGRFDIHIDGVSLLENADFKRGILLVYLLEKGTPQSRAEIARLLWPDSDDTATLGNLRSLLLRMRRDGIEEYLQVDRSTIAIGNHAAIDYDVARWRRLTTALNQASFADLLAAAELYQGEFLSIDALDSHPMLDEWVVSIRSEIEVQAARTLSTLLERGIELHEFEVILPHARKLSTIMPYSNDVQKLLIQIMVGTGQIAEAIQEFYEYKRLLAQDMGITEIDPELVSTIKNLVSPQHVLAKATERPQVAPQATKPAVPHSGRPLGSTPLPYLTTPLIGRKAEVEVMKQVLHNRHRLISVVGMGGIGKSYFVRGMLTFLKEHFGTGLHFIDLESLEQPDTDPGAQLLNAIKTELEVIKPVFGQAVALLDRDVRCLVLDNLKVTAATTKIVEELLQNSPQLQIIVTSRVSLHLRSEQIIALMGLPVSTTCVSKDQADISEAENLFIEHMQNARQRFIPNERDCQFINSICQQVGGLPLAIKFAAEQSNFYELEELAEIILSDNSLLGSEFTGGRQVHKSINEILENMWTDLSEDERNIIKAAALFHGSWHRDSLQAIVSTPRAIYAKFVAMSIFESKDAGWFSLHPLVKRFVLSLGAGQYLTEMKKRYTAHFLGMLSLGEHLLEPVSVTIPETLSILKQQQSNIFSAWRLAVDYREWDLLKEAIVSLGHYIDITEQYAEGTALLQLILEHLPSATLMTTSQQHLAAQAAFFVGLFNAKADCSVSVEDLNIQAIGWLAQVGTPHEVAVVHRHTPLLLPSGVTPPQTKLPPYTREVVKQSAYT